MPSLKIGLDFVNLQSTVDGVGRFMRQLVDGLNKYDSGNEYWVFFSADLAERVPLDESRFHRWEVKLRRSQYWPLNQAFFAMQSHRLPRLDVLHSPVSVAPFIIPSGSRRIVTVHDLAFKPHPETTNIMTRAWQNMAWPICLRQADQIAASSQSTKNDIIRFYGIRADKISVVHLYPTLDPLSPSVSLGEWRDRLKLPPRYILHVGAPHLRKNIPNLLKAFKWLKERTALPQKLLLVGPEGWARAILEKRIHELQLADHVRFSGYIADRDLPAVYAAADLFVFPSFYEGFGYPPLEAMTAGVPMAVSWSSSLPEVVGDAGLYFDPYSPEEICSRMIEILTNPDLRERLRAKGFERIKRFSQKKMIEQYMAIYRSCSH